MVTNGPRALPQDYCKYPFYCFLPALQFCEILTKFEFVFLGGRELVILWLGGFVEHGQQHVNNAQAELTCVWELACHILSNILGSL